MAKAKAAKAPATTGSNQVSMKDVTAAISAMVKASGAFGIAADKAAMTAIQHCEAYGDAGAVQRLHAALSKKRQRQLKAWLTAFTPIRMNNKTKNFGLIKSDAPNYVAFDSDGAASVSFLDFEKPAAPIRMYSNEILAKRIAAMITKDYDGTWEGAALNQDTIIRLANEKVTETLTG